MRAIPPRAAPDIEVEAKLNTMPLYAFGSNGSGQLGIGHTDDVSSPTRCLFEDGEAPVANSDGKTDDVLRIAAGGNHTLVLFRSGRVYAAGWNGDGRCGVTSQKDAAKDDGSEDALLRFRRVILTDSETGNRVDTFRDVSATWEGSFFVADGVVYVLGSGAKGELGLGMATPRTTAEEPRVMFDFPPSGAKARCISSGMGHSVVVLSNGEVYGWGGARKGQLGEAAKAQKIIWTPARITDVPFRTTAAVCGREFTVLMGDKGAGEFAILAAEDDKWGILSRRPNSLERGYKEITASWHGVYVHQNDSSVLAWGRNDRGQLPPADLGDVRQLAVGSEHSLALLEGDAVVAFGWGEHGNCGPHPDAQGNVKGGYNRIPVDAEGGRVVGIAAGCATSWIITS